MYTTTSAHNPRHALSWAQIWPATVAAMCESECHTSTDKMASSNTTARGGEPSTACNRTAGGIGGLSNLGRRVQNGFVRSYALTMLLGVVVVLGALWVVQ